MDYIKKIIPNVGMIFFIFLLLHTFFLTLKFNIILIKDSQYMIFLYKVYN